jgi:hypothetical protein
MFSAFVFASESSCSEVARAWLSIVSASALASLVIRSAISWARPRTLAAWT